MYDKYGRPYSWGVARYTTPECYFGINYMERIYDKEPKNSKNIVAEDLKKLLPHADKKAIHRTLGIKYGCSFGCTRFFENLGFNCWSFADRKGYSGTAYICRNEPNNAI